MNACHEIPNQNIKNIRPLYTNSSLSVKSIGKRREKYIDIPNKTFVQLLKNIVGATRYSNIMNTKVNKGYKSKKKTKK